MKLQLITKPNHSNDEIDKMIDVAHAKIKTQAYNDGKHDAMKEPAMPLSIGDRLMHYITFKSSYENIVMKVLQKIQPIAQIAEGRLEKETADARKKWFTDEIQKLEKHIGILKRELKNVDPSYLASLEKKSIIIGACLCVSEMVINTQAFEVTGENKLSAIIFSFCVSFAVTLGAHYAGRHFKDAKTKTERRLVVFFSALGIIAISTVVASLRTIYFQKIGINDIDALWFTIFNIVFFMIGAYVTWYHYPFKEVIEEHRENIQKQKQIEKLEKEKKQLEKEKQEYERITNEKFKEYVRTLMYAEYAIERIKILYKESVDEYKNANRLSRKDCPDCFNDEPTPLDIPNINFKSIITKYQEQ